MKLANLLVNITDIIDHENAQFLHGFQMVQNLWKQEIIWSSVRHKFIMVQKENNLHVCFLASGHEIWLQW